MRRFSLQVKIWFQNRRTKWKKIDNVSNAEAAEHKNQAAPRDSAKGDEPQAKLRGYVKHINQSSNSSLESDSKSSFTAASTGGTDSPLSARSFKDILHHPPLSPDAHFQSQIDSAKDVLLNLSFNVKDKSY